MVLKVLYMIMLMACVGAGQDIDLIFRTRQSFTSAHLKALGDAGIASIGDVGMGQNNPALLYTSCKNHTGNLMALGYGRDSLFNRHIVPLSLGHIDGTGALGCFYRFQSGECGLSQHEFTANFSGQLFKQVDVQGAVDFGVNIRYEIMNDHRHESRPLTIDRYSVDRNDELIWRATVDTISGEYNGKTEIRRCIVDIGFYQPEIMNHVDFGLVLYNLLGHQWKKEHPYIVATDSITGDTIVAGDTLNMITRTHSYKDATKTKKSWLPGRYRTLTIGVLYRSLNGPLRLLFPIDIEMLGLFDKKIKNTFVFRGGVEAQINEAFSVRIGYARQPGSILEGFTSFKNINVFTGGAGFLVGSVTVDCYFSTGAFGVTAGYGL